MSKISDAERMRRAGMVGDSISTTNFQKSSEGKKSEAPAKSAPEPAPKVEQGKQ
jgi:hypothetical protein